jgi:phenylalanyl-tRNA synthetase beta chain
MKFSVNWLRGFVDLPCNPEQITDLLTRAGVETKGIETRGMKIDNVIVSQIIASSRHPNADRLTVCEVDDASGTKRQIVCGATNYKVGDKVPLALPGAKLPNGTEIRKSKLRGVESEGMLCSPIELSLGEDASGLLILSPEAKVGAPINDLFPSDMILDVEITPNRGDLLSHFGLAREISALTRRPLRLPPKHAAAAPAIRKKSVTIVAVDECPFFSARKIDNVKVGPSPQWLRAKIESVGIRSINNVVDISNFVMLEVGQPTHAFDADKLRSDINVRLARDGEKFLALDGKIYSLKPGNLVVADQERAIGIAGVIGGEETGVTESTKNVLLEAAYFLPASVRRTARELGLPSDASYRFERGVDPEMVLRASNGAAELIQEVAGGTPAKEVHVAGKLPSNPSDVSLTYEKCDRVVGIAIKPKTIDEILTGFGLKKTSAAKTTKWKIPSYRRDLQRDVDLIEEVVRAYGANKIPGIERGRYSPSSVADHAHDMESAWRDRLAAAGLNEVRTSKLISRKATAFQRAIAVKNPLSEDAVALRPSLYAALLDVLVRNVRSGAERVAIFEIGRVFVPYEEHRLAAAFEIPKEERHLGILLWGIAAPSMHWRSLNKRSVDFFGLKGAIESLNIPFSFRRRPVPELTIEIWSNNVRVGWAMQIAAERTITVGSTGDVLFAELNVDLFPVSTDLARRFRELEKFPAVTRDIAMIVPENLMHAEILRAIQEPAEPLLESVQLFDLFEMREGAAPIASAKSLAYRLTYRAKNRTLTNEEVTAAHAKIRERLKRELGVTLRE